MSSTYISSVLTRQCALGLSAVNCYNALPAILVLTVTNSVSSYDAVG